MEHQNGLSAPCATITGHRPSRWMTRHPQRNCAGSLPIIPPQFFNRQPHCFLSVAFLPISPPFDQGLLPFLASCHEDLVELMLDPRINPEAADRPFGPSDAGPSDAEAADRPFGPSNADKTRPAQPLRGVPLPSIILPSIRIPVALPCLVFISVNPNRFPRQIALKRGASVGRRATPGLWPGEIDSHIRFEAGVLVFCRHSLVHRRHGWWTSNQTASAMTGSRRRSSS